MTRMIVIGIVMAFAIGFVGCRSCLAPYDHCQPTFIPERGDQCMGELYRCGSVLGGMNRTSNANGDCESCGGGNVEYFDTTGAELSAAPAQTIQSASATNYMPNPPAPPVSNVGAYYPAN
ncbi:MAG: hypothetical protein IJU03_06875 [Thermoguttaceae bacterium]|nr:hypothetical protein [Thermoguttaceae bacterium]